MHQTRENLDFLFRRLSPEMLLSHIRSDRFSITVGGAAHSRDTQRFLGEAYEHYAPLNMSEYSYDELDLREQTFLKEMDAEQGSGVFAPLISYAEKVLLIQNLEPVCKVEEILNWNSITKRLGQDIFTSSWLAWGDVRRQIEGNWSFIWPAVVRSNDKALEQILKKGLAENHFHLNGSTQVFSVSWACLMNHPEYISKIVKKSNDNLTIGISRGPKDNVLSLRERLLYAVMIRQCLSRRCIGLLTPEKVCEEFMQFDSFVSAGKMTSTIEAFRECYGRKFTQPDRSMKCLDYAINDSFYRVDVDSANRLLAGERGFLYCCFRKQFEGNFTALESELLHLYLLIKSNFAGELIQNNSLYGFHNFQEYQARKDASFYGKKEYEVEAYRLAVLAQIQDNHLLSLEARIMPWLPIKKNISEIDSMIKTAMPEKTDWEHYYVIHFRKSKFTKEEIHEESYVQVPRNYEVRQKAKQAALALKKYIRQYEMVTTSGDVEQRIFGIDACSKEIGCGPETFATEFRYLRECSAHRESLPWWQVRRENFAELGFTYHAGEDFLDIIDGLRSIDETVEFLQLRRGDRIGHAIALGVQSKGFYNLKRYNVYLSKQTYLDNLVWILNRSLEWNVEIAVETRFMFEKKARELIQYIYWDNKPGAKYHEGVLDTYFYSWKLREDHPDLYRQEKPVIQEGWGWEDYTTYMARINDNQLNQYREIESVIDLVKLYHFDNGVKRRGLEAEQIQIDDWNSYADLVTQFQERLQRKIADRGIAVECNLTSNVLIGTFRKYDTHPILRFNRHKLGPNECRPNILASLNTDDLGVFSTSLGNEYALLLCALRKARHIEGKRDDMAIYDYLDYLRECGISMAFK